MKKHIFSLILLSLALLPDSLVAQPYQQDTLKTQLGDLVITFIGHGSLRFTYQELEIYVDPVEQVGDYSQQPKADLILVTHEHGDHLDPGLIGKLSKEGTEILLTEKCHDKLNKGRILKNYDQYPFYQIRVEAVPAYNRLHTRGNGQPYHPMGDGNGYVLTFADLKVYVAGDTEYIPEMNDLKNIDVAFLPVALPYTMSVEMADRAARVINPAILYPYHLNKTQPEDLVKLLMDTEIDVRIRALR